MFLYYYCIFAFLSFPLLFFLTSFSLFFLSSPQDVASPQAYEGIVKYLMTDALSLGHHAYSLMLFFFFFLFLFMMWPNNCHFSQIPFRE